MAKAIDFIRDMGPRLGLKLYIGKTEIFWPLCDGSTVHGGCSLRKLGAQCRRRIYLEGMLVKMEALSKGCP